MGSSNKYSPEMRERAVRSDSPLGVKSVCRIPDPWWPQAHSIFAMRGEPIGISMRSSPQMTLPS